MAGKKPTIVEKIKGSPLKVKSFRNTATYQELYGGGSIQPPLYHGGVWRVKLSEEHFTFHLQYKHSGAFANRKCEEFFYPTSPKTCDLILVTQVMQPYFSQSSHENATPSSGTFSLASYKKVPPPPGCDAPILKADRHTCATLRHIGVKKKSGWQDRSAEDPNK